MEITRKHYLLFAVLIGAAIWVGLLITRKWLLVSSFARPTPTVPLEPPASVMRYSDPYLGFAVEYPTGWEVIGPMEDPTGQSLAVVGFGSNLYAGGSQSIGKYSVNVAVRETVARTVTETVEYRLSIIGPSVREGIKRRCCLMVGGEPAMELTGLPGRWGSRQIVVIHDRREYWLIFYPYQDFNTPSDVVARAAFDAFLRTFTFVPITVLPTPTITPVPTRIVTPRGI